MAGARRRRGVAVGSDPKAEDAATRARRATERSMVVVVREMVDYREMVIMDGSLLPVRQGLRLLERKHPRPTRIILPEYSRNYQV